ncbi:MAG: acetate uptake transporter [Methanotrichaceae archaeon]
MHLGPVEVTDKSSNPAPLGLMGFGMTTVLLNMANAGWFPVDTLILSMGVFYGGIAQIIAGIMEWKKGNTFGTTAFTSYGLFWLTLVSLLVMPKLGLWTAASNSSLIAYFFMWGLFTFYMFMGTLRLNRALQVVFGTLTVLFWLLAIRDYTGSAVIATITGYEGIFCGFTAIYAAAAQVLNEVYGKVILPIGPVSKIAKKGAEKAATGPA